MWHLTLTTADRSRLWTEDAGCVRALRAMGRICGPRLLVFCLVDDHAHLVLATNRQRAGRQAGALLQSLQATAAGPMAPADIRRVEGRSHLVSLVGYTLRQPVRHDLGVHPAIWPGGCLLDLLGIRVLPGFSPETLRTTLPRMRPSQLLRRVGLDERLPAALDADGVHGLGPRGVLQAAGHALAADPSTNTPEAVAARAAAVQLCLEAGLRPGVVADRIGLSRRAARRLAQREVPERSLVSRACALHAAVCGRSIAPSESERKSIARSRFLSGGLSDGALAAVLEMPAGCD